MGGQSIPPDCTTGQEETASRCVRGGLHWTLGKISSPKRSSSVGMGCPER